jgi:hypothetical protein
VSLPFTPAPRAVFFNAVAWALRIAAGVALAWPLVRLLDDD